MMKRTKSRVWAVQVAYTMHLSGEDPADILAGFFRWRRIAEQNRVFTAELVETLADNLEQVDELIAAHLRNWSPQRLALLDRIILRLGIAELLFVSDVPPKVTINEYVELARMFGTDDSPPFVNAVLDAVHRETAAGAGSRESAEGGS